MLLKSGMKITKIRDESGYITTNFTETRWTTREYYKNFILDNLLEKNKFLEK